MYWMVPRIRTPSSPNFNPIVTVNKTINICASYYNQNISAVTRKRHSSYVTSRVLLHISPFPVYHQFSRSILQPINEYTTKIIEIHDNLYCFQIWDGGICKLFYVSKFRNSRQNLIIFCVFVYIFVKIALQIVFTTFE